MREQYGRLKVFLQEVNQEVRRVTWPTSKELVGATAVVIVTTVVLALVLGVYDLLIARLIGAVLR